MGHSVAQAVLGNQLASVMGTPSPATADTRSYRRARESLAIRMYNEMLGRLKTMMSGVGLAPNISTVPINNKRTHDALQSALSQYGFSPTKTVISELEKQITHDRNEIIRLGTIVGGTNTVFNDFVSNIPKLNISISEKTKYIDMYNSGQIFVDVGAIISSIQNSNDLKRDIEAEKQRITFEDELSEEAKVANFDKIARDTLLNYTTLSTQNNTTIEEYNIWLLQEEKIKSDLEKERLTTQTQEETHEPEVIISDTVTTGTPTDVIVDDSIIPVKKTIGAGILALGVIGIILALKYNKK
tara:strand:- start:2009 stop:2905 length:897 start_codon:yes stop_codon:yes gene_type:complete